ncbi:Nuclear transcription factor Y subunit C-5 [Dissostichus eleginoides]|uniref:Nuclear transcription factor Y subunit C-5 n=1 Tax=Dissostichus eleginoides TaxID=100907 RepID=A0AAD9F6Z9_DISEL|nr:Nuclear transcription factor Y subunit C-5 [Dissostichus eleginoides]
MEPVAIAPELALPLTRVALIIAQKSDPTLTKCFDAAENPNECNRKQSFFVDDGVMMCREASQGEQQGTVVTADPNVATSLACVVSVVENDLIVPSGGQQCVASCSSPRSDRIGSFLLLLLTSPQIGPERTPPASRRERTSAVPPPVGWTRPSLTIGCNA